MKPFARSDRVSGQIQRALSDLLRKSIKDPRLEKVIITGVKMSKDLRLARIYFTLSDHVLSDPPGPQKEAAEGLKSALGFIKRTLAQQLGLRYMPDLRFYYDESFDYGEKIETLLKTLKTDHAPDN
jgi:ribosome-binding factor A